jgi:micrococcal nuclease
VTLITDSSQGLYDRYGRLLAYVVRRRGRLDLALAQLAAGWARVYVYSRPFHRVGRYRRASRRARSLDRGVWGRCHGRFHLPLG